MEDASIVDADAAANCRRESNAIVFLSIEVRVVLIDFRSLSIRSAVSNKLADMNRTIVLLAGLLAADEPSLTSGLAAIGKITRDALGEFV
jgi:hypothetical protein